MQALWYKVVLAYWHVRSSAGKSFVHVVHVVLESTLCKLCSTKQFREVFCASFVVRSSTGKYFVQAL